MEINEDHPNESQQSLFIQSCCSKGVSSITCFWQTHGRQRSGKALEWRKGRLQVCPDWRLWARGAGGGEASVADTTLEGGFALGKLAVIDDNVQAILGRLLTRAVPWLPELVAADCGSEFYFYIQCGCMYSYS